MGEPIALTNEELVELFRARGMIIEEGDLDKIQHINYYKLKEFAKPLATIRKSDNKIEINYNGLSLREVLIRYHKDKTLRMHLLHAIEMIEISVKTNFSRILGREYGAFGYLDFSKWANRQRNSKYYLEKKQYKTKRDLLDAIERNKPSELVISDNLDQDKFPTIWLAIDLLTFGSVVKMIELLNEKHLEELANVYNCTKTEFKSWMNCLYFIRNHCAHNSNIIDMKLTTKPRLRKYWKDKLYFISKDEIKRKKPTDRIAIVIFIVMELTLQINDEYKCNQIQKSLEGICIDDHRANLFGFQSFQASKHLRRFILEQS